MANEAATPPTTAAKDEPTKPQTRKQNKQDEMKRHRSIFDVPLDFFDSCRLLHSPFSSLPDSDDLQDDAVEESKPEKEIIEINNNNYAKVMQKWSCNTCKAEFESLQDQRFHFKSDLHRFNVCFHAVFLQFIRFARATDWSNWRKKYWNVVHKLDWV